MENSQKQEDLLSIAKNGIKKPFAWKWWALGVVVILIVGAGFYFKGGNSSTFTLAKVERGDLVQTVEVSGELESFLEADIAFESSGTVSRVFVQSGDEVSEGQVMAILGSTEILADLSASEQALYLAEANLNQFLAGATDQELASAQASLDSAQADLLSKQELAVLNVAVAQTALEYAQADFTHTINENQEDLDESYEDLRTILFSSLIDVRGALSSADEILGIENTLYNDSFEQYLSATDPQQLTSAKNAFKFSAEYRDSAEDLVYALSSSSSTEQINLATGAVELALSYTSSTLLYTRRVLDNTSCDTVDLSLADVSTFKASIDVERDAVQAGQAALVGQRQTIASLILSTQDAQDYAQNLVDTKQQAYDQAMSNATSSVAIAEATASMRQADFDSLTVSKRAVDTAAYYAQVGQAQAQMAAIEARLAKTEIHAPFAGIVTHMDLSMGEAVSAGVAVAGVQSSTEQYRILVDVPEADIVKIAIDDQAEVTFDAYGEGVKVPAHVGRINPGESNIEGVVYYQVEIYLDDGEALVLKSGMSADVVIQTEIKTDVLYVQQRAVYQHEDGTKYVRTPNGDLYDEQIIVTGLRADGGLVEIISGLKEGDEVITAIN
ncbi:efflux RND transporter periplasmic adaptor subunit [Patescibacteria group bacterium]|nr:efflux RND transporter periplasmic adaptor subunit [Patescibacteria group bacterium]